MLLLQEVLRKSLSNSRRSAAPQCLARIPSSSSNKQACQTNPRPARESPQPRDRSLFSPLPAIPDHPVAIPFESPSPPLPLCVSVFGPSFFSSPFLCVLCALCVEIPLRPFPPPRFPSPEHRLNHRHIRDRILQRYRNLTPLANRPRKRVSLHRILVANRNRFHPNTTAKHVASIINRNSCRTVRRRIKWYLDLDPPGRPQELHPLVMHKLRATRKHRLPRRKFQNHRRQPVRLKIGVEFDQRRDARRLLPKNEPRRGNRVAPDIHHPAPSPLCNIPHVLRISIEVTERSLILSQLSDHSLANQLACPQPLGMGLHHERFADFDTAAVAHAQQRTRLRNAHTQWLLAQHMLPCLRRFDRPRHVQMIRQRIVNRFDLRIGKQLFVGTVRLRDSQLFRGALRFLQIPRGDRRDFAPLPFLHSRDHLPDGDPCHAPHPPFHFRLCHISASPVRRISSGLNGFNS